MKTSGRIAFAANARFGQGGQGEFLRQMVGALDGLGEGGLVVSREARSISVRCRDIPFDGPRRRVFDWIRRIPVLRGRRDWLTLLSDVQFDRASIAAVNVEPPFEIVDGVMGQCCEMFRRLEAAGTKRVLTCLNTHLDYLCDTLRDEHRRLAIPGRHFVHPRMRHRVLSEMRMAHHFRVNSPFAKATLVDRGIPEHRVTVILPGVDTRHFRPSPTVRGKFRVLAVSTVEPRKGIHYLLKAFEDAAIPDSELVLIGASGDRWSAKMLNDYRDRNSNIRLMPCDVLAEPSSSTYGAASVLVHPALEDGFGLVVTQALASGCPVIATRETGAAACIEDGLNGFVIDRRDSDAIRDKLLLLHRDRELLGRLAARAPESVRHLALAGFERAVSDFYGGLLERPLPRGAATS